MKQLLAVAAMALALVGCGAYEGGAEAELKLATRADALCSTSTQCSNGSTISCSGEFCSANSSSVTCDGTTTYCPSTGCTISGTYYANGTRNPSNPCQICDVSKSTSSWTNYTGSSGQSGTCKSTTGACVSGPCAGYSCATNSDCGGYCQSGGLVCDVLW